MKTFRRHKSNFDAVTAENAELKMNSQRLGERCDTAKKELGDPPERFIRCDPYSRNFNLEIKCIPKAAKRYCNLWTRKTKVKRHASGASPEQFRALPPANKEAFNIPPDSCVHHYQS